MCTFVHDVRIDHSTIYFVPRLHFFLDDIELFLDLWEDGWMDGLHLEFHFQKLLSSLLQIIIVNHLHNKMHRLMLVKCTKLTVPGSCGVLEKGIQTMNMDSVVL